MTRSGPDEIRTQVAPAIGAVKTGGRGKRARQPLRSVDLAYMGHLHSAMVTHSTHGASLMLWITAVIVGVALIWAKFAVLEEITVGQGRVISTSREQVIQNLEGGILAEMEVKEGDVVEKGQVLLRIDGAKANAVYREGVSKLLALKGAATRLRAEAFGRPLKFPDDVRESPDIVATETEAFNARRRALVQGGEALRRSLALAEREMSITEPLSAKGLVSEIELLKLRRQANDLRAQIAERENKYRSDANTELSKVEGELAQVGENVLGRQDVVERTTVRAPLRGTVKNIRVTTIGGIIQAGTDIMEIVPLEDQLLVEARIKPSDVAFLRPGLPATVKISAYDFGIYGGLEGTIEHVSPDTFKDEKRTVANPEDSAYYRLLVRTKTATLKRNDVSLEIIPGMTASVEILTGHKSVLDYLLKPVFKAQEAMRER